MSLSDVDLFEHAFRHAPIGMALVAPNGRWLKVNDALCQLVGYRREELLASDFQTITHPDDLKSDLAEVARLLSGDIESYSLEKRYLRRDGSIIWILLSVSLVREAGGAPRFFISQIQDISRTKRAEADFERLFEGSPDMMAMAGPGHRLEIVNQAWERTLGWKRQELLGRDFLELVHPDDRQRTLAASASARVEGGDARLALRIRCQAKAGDYRWLEWHTSDAQDGRLICAVRDVTAHVEQAKMRGWLAAIVETSNDAIIGVDAGGIIFSWNAGAARLYGYSAAQMHGRHITELGADEVTREQIKAVLDRATGGEAHQGYDAPRTRRDGSQLDVHVDVRRVEDDQGCILGWSVTARDISERKRLADALSRQLETYTAIARSLPRGAVGVFDRDLKCTGAAGELINQLGFSPTQLIGRSVVEVTSPPYRSAMEGMLQQALNGVATELEAERGDLMLLIRVAPLHDVRTGRSGGLILILDVTAQRREAEELRRAKLLLDATVSNMKEGVALVGPDRRILVANEAYAQIYGLDRAQLVGYGTPELAKIVERRFEDAPRVMRAIDNRAQGEDLVEDFVLREPTRRVLRRTVTPVGGDEGGFVVVWRDVTKEHDLIGERQREALTDALTGIANRRGGEVALQAALARAAESGTPLTVALFDIDHFKQVNDVYGHQRGDLVIQAVARVLASQARATDTVARWGGEEFLAILPVPPAGAASFCERVRLAVRALEWPGLNRVTISAGIATRSDGDAAELVKRADDKLYQAKRAGRDRVVT